MPKPSHLSLSQIVDLGILGEIEVEVEYSYTPGTPDVMYLSNGDPGHPGDPAEFEILKVTFNGENITFLFDGNDAFETLIAEEAAENFAESITADRADYEYDQYRERQLEAAWEAERS